MLGIFIGSGLADQCKTQGVYYSKSTLKSDANADLTLESKKIRRLSRKSIADISKLISKRQIVELDEVAIKFTDKKIVYVLNSGGRPSASETARLLAIKSAQTGRSVVLCDTTGESERKNEVKPIQNTTLDLSIVSVGDNFNLMTGTGGASFFTSADFGLTIKNLTDRFDKVFICSSYANAQLGLMAVAEFLPG